MTIPFRILIRLLRLPNLFIIAFTLFTLRNFVFQPVLQAAGSGAQMSTLHFNLMTFITVLIALFGYVLNDYCDVETDLINRPETVYAGRYVKFTSISAFLLMMALLISLLAISLSVLMHSLWPFVFLFTALGVSAWYAHVLKKSFLWGNLAVAAMTASTIVMAWVLEAGSAQAVPGAARKLITGIVLTFSVFAFLLNLAREIVKDMEDFKGDAATGCQSLPVVKGIDRSRKTVLAIALLVFVLLVIIQDKLIISGKWPAALWLTACCVVPLAMFGYRLRKAETPEQFHTASNLLKIIMMGGILTIFAAQF